MDVPQWLQISLQNRFDHLAQKFQSIPEIEQLLIQSDQYLQQFLLLLEPEIRESFLMWEEHATTFHAKQSEWLYMRGVQDGLELLSLRFLMSESE